MRYKVYENHKRKIAPQYAQHKSFLVWDEKTKRIVYSYFVKGDADKTAELLNEETENLQTELETTKLALESQSQALAECRAKLERYEAAMTALVPVLSEMAAFGTSRQFHKITLGNLMLWTEMALKITQLAKLAALENVDMDELANKVFAKIDAKQSLAPTSTVESNKAKEESLDLLTQSVEILTGVPMQIIPYITKDNDLMASFWVGNAELVAFPKTWHDYKHAISKAALDTQPLGFHIRPIEKDGKIQYMVTGILGVAATEYQIECEYCDGTGQDDGLDCEFCMGTGLK